MLLIRYLHIENIEPREISKLKWLYSTLMIYS